MRTTRTASASVQSPSRTHRPRTRAIARRHSTAPSRCSSGGPQASEEYVVDGQTDVAAHVREGLGEVARLPVEGIAVQQQDRHPRDRRLAQQPEQQHRVDPVQVEVAVAEPDVQLQRQARPRGRVDAEDRQQR